MTVEKFVDDEEKLPIELFSYLMDFFDAETLSKIPSLDKKRQELSKDKSTLKNVINSSLKRYFHYHMGWYKGEDYNHQLLKAILIIGEKKKSLFPEAISILESILAIYLSEKSDVLNKINNIKLKISSSISPIESRIQQFQEIASFLEALSNNLLPLVTFLLSIAFSQSETPDENILKAIQYAQLSSHLHDIKNPGFQSMGEDCISNRLTVLFNAHRLIKIQGPEFKIPDTIFFQGYALEIFKLLRDSYFIHKYSNFYNILLNSTPEVVKNTILDVLGIAYNHSDYKRLSKIFVALLENYISKDVQTNSAVFINLQPLFPKLDRNYFKSFFQSSALTILVNITAKYNNPASLDMLNTYQNATTEYRKMFDSILSTIFEKDAFPQLELLFCKGILFDDKIDLSNEKNKDILDFWLDKENYYLLKAIKPEILFRVKRNTFKLLFKPPCLPYILNFEEYHLSNLQQVHRYISNHLEISKALSRFFSNFSLEFLLGNVSQAEKLIHICSFKPLFGQTDELWNKIIEFCKLTQALFDSLPPRDVIRTISNLSSEQIEEIKVFLVHHFADKNINKKTKLLFITLLNNLILVAINKNAFFNKMLDYLYNAKNPKVETARAILLSKDDFLFDTFSWNELSNFSYNALRKLIEAEPDMRYELLQRVRKDKSPDDSKRKNKLVYSHSSDITLLSEGVLLKKRVADILNYKVQCKEAFTELKTLKEHNATLKRKLNDLELKSSKRKKSNHGDSYFFKNKNYTSKEELTDGEAEEAKTASVFKL